MSPQHQTKQSKTKPSKYTLSKVKAHATPEEHLGSNKDKPGNVRWKEESQVVEPSQTKDGPNQRHDKKRSLSQGQNKVLAAGAPNPFGNGDASFQLSQPVFEESEENVTGETKKH